MGIRVVHQPIGIAGVAAYATGQGRARQRKRKEMLSLYRDEQQRRERRELQYQGFSYQAALEGMRQGAIGERAAEQREFELEDIGQQREWDIEDAERKQQQAEKDRKAGEEAAIGLEETRQQGRQARDAAQIEMDIDKGIREGVRSGELELPPGAQAEFDEADKIEADANKPENGLTDAERAEAKATADKIRRDAWRTAKPSAKPSVGDTVKGNVYWDGGKWGKGTPWVTDPKTGKPEIVTGYKPDDQADQFKEGVRGIMKEPKGDTGVRYSIEEAIIEQKKRDRLLDEATAPSAPPTSTRTHGVPKPPPGYGAQQGAAPDESQPLWRTEGRTPAQLTDEEIDQREQAELEQMEEMTPDLTGTPEQQEAQPPFVSTPSAKDEAERLIKKKNSGITLTDDDLRSLQEALDVLRKGGKAL